MVRVRFAPSPTGEPHVGSAWAALFNWLYARHSSGTFILRIEDTDRARSVPGAVDRIYEMLDWLGLTPDEGPREGGKFGPYVQSERLEHYRDAANTLLAGGAAYRCFCTPERLHQLRAEQQGRGEAPMYDRRCRAIPLVESERRAAQEPFVIRLAIPDSETIANDIIRGKVRWDNATLDDSVLLKSDGFPTYHLANVVDDHAMEITHVIRAEEWLPSLPKHLILYRAFDWTPPQFAHLPLILGADRKKLSKRHGHTAVLEYRTDYLPDAFMNFLALMGWRPTKSNQEIFTRKQLIQLFDLKDVRKSGAVFDVQKLNYINHRWKQNEPQQLKALMEYYAKKVFGRTHPIDAGLAQLSSQDAPTIEAAYGKYESLETPPGFDRFEPRQLHPPSGSSVSKAALSAIIDALQKQKGWNEEALNQTLNQIREKNRWTVAQLHWPFRIALSHSNPSPNGVKIAVQLGPEKTLQRLKEALDTL